MIMPRYKRLSAPALFVALVLLALAAPFADAQDAVSQGVTLAPQAMKAAPAGVRTWTEMQTAATVEAMHAASVQTQTAVPFRPTMGAAQYQQLKGQSASKLSLTALAPARPELPPALGATPVVKGVNFEGVNSVTAGGYRPADAHGAAGLSHFVEVSNSHLDVYLKASPFTRVRSATLASFFGYTAKLLVTPRVVFDNIGKRWIVSAVALPESSKVQYFFFAVSLTADPTKSFYVYKVNIIAPDTDRLWDYPILGMDRNAVIWTANYFVNSTGNYVDGRVLVAAKAKLYSGQAATLQLFTSLETTTYGNIAPPIVRDTNPSTFLVGAPALGNMFTLYKMTNSGGVPSMILYGVPVAAYTLPPYAPQPGTTALLDTLDSRFVNAGTQIGNALYQVHTIAYPGGGGATPKWYKINTLSRAVVQSGFLYKSTTSSDFNASIAVNGARDVFLTWNSTDSNANVQVRFTGWKGTDALASINKAGVLLNASTTFYNPSAPTTNVVERWGDYSAVSLDPAVAGRAWIVNQKVRTAASWGSRIGSIGF